MRQSCILAIDQGTTGSRAIAYDRQGRPLASAYREFAQYFPQPGWVEHDADEIWDSVRAVCEETVAQTGGLPVHAVGIANQRETCVVWERDTGRPAHRAIVWQSRQSVDICERLRREGWEERVRQKTGLLIDAYFSATKIRWILDRIPNGQARAQAGELAFGTIDSWLLWKLCGRHATDISNACRTMLYNIHTQSWDPELFAMLDIPTGMAPEVCDNAADFGAVGDAIPALRDVPVCGMAGDQQAALFGQTCFEPGMVKNTYGTGCFMLMNVGDRPARPKQGLLSTVAWRIGGATTYALEGAVFVAGSAVKWMRDAVQWVETASETEALALSLPSTEGVVMVPAFVGLGAPYWDSRARGAILGLTRGSTRAHLVRAALESVAFQTKDLLQMMESESGLRLSSLRVDGGMTANNFLMQFQSDLLGASVERPALQESTALGAAYLAGLQSGYWTGLDEIVGFRKVDRLFEPQMAPSAARALYERWQKAVEAARLFGSQ